MSNDETVTVASVIPFWRYAVCPTNKCAPGVPFYRLTSVLAFFEETRRHLPWAGVQLVRRRFLRGVDLYVEFIPKEAA